MNSFHNDFYLTQGHPKAIACMGVSVRVSDTLKIDKSTAKVHDFKMSPIVIGFGRRPVNSDLFAD